MHRKLPAITPENSAFWQGGAEGRLMIHHCDACAKWFHPPAPICPHCASRGVSAKAVSGRGSVYSFTVNRQAWDADLAEPYVVATVELAEQRGLRFVTNVIDCPVQTVSIDMPVAVRFMQQEDIWLPLFAPEAA
ncbi:Zn-ribbon domain-containing OB-fold protein [Sphingomonas sp. BAUL-RG-20F-R05-02]|uniref:Zn-ribbon domain-containing OB-fold protein n=1 Tax=Sphingomonas sp. BAUL-RG-20F-R05-02 TaxID=2914830 RepID=UPI001F58B1E9|nr:OB-fold domain-containing protein [Sphingomonas sp. BAUL-RG-20F-R05-02]